MMFGPNDVQSRLRQRPFTRVRIVTTAGDTCDVHHPELVIVGRRFLMVGLPSSEEPTQAEQVTRVALGHVTELRDLPSPTAPSNGSPG